MLIKVFYPIDKQNLFTIYLCLWQRKYVFNKLFFTYFIIESFVKTSFVVLILTEGNIWLLPNNVDAVLFYKVHNDNHYKWTILSRNNTFTLISN